MIGDERGRMTAFLVEEIERNNGRGTINTNDEAIYGDKGAE